MAIDWAAEFVLCGNLLDTGPNLHSVAVGSAVTEKAL